MGFFDKRKKLRVLYAQLPKIECKGLCHQACGPVSISCGPHEAREAERMLGAPLTHDPATLTCSALDDDHRCRIYEHRPMLCRVYGVAEGLQCPHGCEPEKLLTDAEARKLLNASDKI